MPSILCSAIVSIFALQFVGLFAPIEVRGHVYEPDGGPAAYATVEAIDPGRASGSMSIGFTVVDRAGNFVLRLPAYGRYDITASEATNGFSIGAQAKAHTMVDFRYGDRPEIKLRLQRQ
jgi:Carboxypeptidase regulatory-like domain